MSFTKPKKFVCNECEKEFSLIYKGKATPEICPFCGDIIDAVNETPFLKDFDDYDDFDDAKYYADEDDEIEND